MNRMVHEQTNEFHIQNKLHLRNMLSLAAILKLSDDLYERSGV